MVDIPTEVPVKDLLINSPFYFAKEVFNYRVDGPHETMMQFFIDTSHGMLLCPRGHGKSKISQSYIAWLAVNNPDMRILIVSDSDTKATLFLSTIKNTLEYSPIIKEYYGDVRGSVWTDHAIVIKGRKHIQTEPTVMSVGSSSGRATGLHVDVILLDDCESFDSARSEIKRNRLQEWYKTTLAPCLMANGKTMVCGTRYHFSDIYELLLTNFGFEKLILPAIKDEKALCEWLVPLNDKINPDGSITKGLKTIKSELGEIIWNLQYENNVELLKEGNIIKYTDLMWYDSLYHDENNQVYILRDNNKKIKIGKIVIGNDPAISEKAAADDSAYIISGMGSDNNIYILESINKKLSFNKQINMIEHLVEKWQPNEVNIEKIAFQEALITELKRRGGLKIRDIVPGRDKVARTMGVTGFFEDHRVYLQKSMQDLIDQLIIFPEHIHDDLVDACTYSLMGMKYGTVEPISISL